MVSLALSGSRARAAVIAVAALVGLLASACSSSGSGGGVGASGGSGGGVGASGGSGGGVGASGASTEGKCTSTHGSPVKVLAILDESQTLNVFTPDLRAGIDARVKSANCAGGVGTAGAPLKVDYCRSNFDPNLVQACVRKLVSGGYVAALGTNTAEGDAPVLLAKAGIANVPSISLEASNFTAKTTFNIDSGGLVAAGAVVVACKAGLTRIKEIRLGVPLTQVQTKLENAALQANGCAKIAESVDLPSGATDASSEVTAASQGADAVLLDMGAQNAAQVLKARQQLGIKTTFVLASLQASADNLRSIGTAADGALVGGWFPPQGVPSKGESQFEADMTAAGQSSQVDDYARTGWVSVDMFVTALKSATSVDRAGVLAALRGLTSYNAGGMMPTVDFSKDGPNPEYPRMVNLTVTPGVVMNGKIATKSGLPKFVPIFG